ncbi:MAG: hypothetical protein KIT74_07230 [Fimbriimonadales bacterium]|nr:hypothetical protein [Fimbriimonadales bacterium]
MKARLSMAFQDLRGKDGNVVIKGSRNGLVLTPYVSPRNPRTGPQRAIRGYFRQSGKTFETMTVPQVEAWEDYAQTINIVDPITGKSYHPTAINAFVQLGVKFLQLNPSGTLPLTPPTSEFVGDTIGVSVSSPSAGVIRFTGSGDNASGVTTELLLQRLPSPHWKPSPLAYRHEAWYVFTSEEPTKDVDVSPGWYAAAYRFVKNTTGQATDLIALPMQQVTLAVVEGGKVTSRQSKKAA